MLNHLIIDSGCEIATRGGQSYVGIYGGVETIHGEWSVLVAQATGTVSIPMHCIEDAAPTIL